MENSSKSSAHVSLNIRRFRLMQDLSKEEFKQEREEFKKEREEMKAEIERLKKEQRL